MHQKTPKIDFFPNFSKSSEKVAFLQKKVYQNPQQRSRCRYRHRKKSKTTKQKFFRFGFGLTICRKLLEEWKQPSRLYNQKHLIPVFFSCSVETTLSGNGERHLRGCHRESWGESQTILSKNLKGFSKWQFEVWKKWRDKKKGIASNFSLKLARTNRCSNSVGDNLKKNILAQ